MSRPYSPKLFLILCLIFLLPSLVFVVLHASSLAIGLLLGCIITLALNLDLKLRVDRTGLYLLALVFLLLAGSSGYSLLAYGIGKPLVSLPLIALLAISAFVFSRFLLSLPYERIQGTIWRFSLLLVFIGWFRFLYVPDFLGYQSFLKPVFPFSEVSHYVLVAGFFFCIYSFIGTRRRSLFLLVNTLAFALLCESLLFLIFGFLMLFINLLRRKPIVFKLSLIVIMPLAIVSGWLLLRHIDYFSARLNLSNASNFTTLVFLQGWELSELNLFGTHGLGLGFQMLGSPLTQTGAVTEVIGDKLSLDETLNLSDGGFLAAKIIAEFGILGVCLLLGYLVWFVKTSFSINKAFASADGMRGSGIRLLMLAIPLSFFPELFFRGYGYFSPSLFLVLTSGFLFFELRKVKVRQPEVNPRWGNKPEENRIVNGRP